MRHFNPFFCGLAAGDRPPPVITGGTQSALKNLLSLFTVVRPKA
jgi:hypothetical protein